VRGNRSSREMTVYPNTTLTSCTRRTFLVIVGLKIIFEKYRKEIMECRRLKTIMKMKQYVSDSAVYVPRILVSRENCYFVPGGKAVRRNRRRAATAESAMFGINTS
jgi:hypothetical protein